MSNYIIKPGDVFGKLDMYSSFRRIPKHQRPKVNYCLDLERGEVSKGRVHAVKSYELSIRGPCMDEGKGW